MRKFKVANVNCQNCVNLIKNSLEEEFGKIEVDLNQEPRILSLEISDEKLIKFKQELEELNFKILEEF